MSQFIRALMVSLQFGIRCKNIRGLCRIIFNGICSSVESPELPVWFKLSKRGDSNNLNSDDDFVLPTLMESSSEDHDHKANVKIITQESADPEVDEVSHILKTNFTSPGLVVKALGNCSARVSKQSVDKILRRFSNDWVPAFGFFLWSGSQIGCKHSFESYDTMVDTLGKCKQFDLMWGLVEEMVQIGGLVSLVTMTKVMRRLVGAGRWGEAISTFRNLERFGVKKDIVSMNVLLDTLCKEKSVKHAKEAFLEFSSGIPPDSTSFNMLIHGWCKAKKLEEARRTMVEMREFGFNPCVIAYTGLIEAYCLENNFQMVYAILGEMQRQGCSPNIVTYTIIMHSLGKAKKIEEALKIFDRVKKDGCPRDTSFYNSLIYVLSRAGRLQDANDVYEEMCKSGTTPNVTTDSTLISAACRCSQEKDALMLLLKMEENSCEPDIKTYGSLLKLCCGRQWIRMLLYLLGHMFRKNINPDYGTYVRLINGLRRNGVLVQSCLFFKEMVLKGLIPKHFTYNKLVDALEKERMDSAKEKIQQLVIHAQKLRGTGNYLRDKKRIKEL